MKFFIFQYFFILDLPLFTGWGGEEDLVRPWMFFKRIGLNFFGGISPPEALFFYMPQAEYGE